ncbi:MAG: PAS domain S-box protein [Bacteroidales bacterium]|nr:PAS domain S-box protein [Bacteroidales bacterium]
MGNQINIGDLNEFTTLEKLDLWVQIIDTNGKLVFMNKYAEKYCGYSSNEFKGNHLFWEKLFNNREAGLRLLNIFRNNINGANNINSKTIKIKIRTGESKCLLWSMNIIKDHEGNTKGAVIFGQDYTTISLKTKQENTDEKRYRHIFRNAPIGFFRSLPEGRFLEINNAFATLLGYSSPEEVLEEVGNIATDVYVDKGLREKVLKETINTGEVKSYETIFKDRWKNTFDVRLNISSHYDKEINSTILEGTIENITARKNAEKANRVMLQVAKAVSTTDEIDELFDLIRIEITTLIDTKNFFLALFDASNNTLSLPFFQDEKDHFDQIPTEKTLSSLVLNTKKSMFLRYSDIMKLADEGKIDFVGTVAKVWLGIPIIVESEVLGLMVVQNYENENAIREEHQRLLEMISPQIGLSIKRKQSEKLLKESEKQLRESNQTKDQFFNIIAHDLKNPFNAIIGFSSLLTEEWNEFDDEDKISMISSIKSSSEGAYELLMNLLEWSRLHVGKMTYDPEFIDYGSLVRINFSLLKTAADKKNIKLVSNGFCEKMVYADPNMIKTVIRNLLTNAIKFTPDHGIISVNCYKNPEIPGMMNLAIKDSGVGIPSHELEDLFNLAKSQSTTGTRGETGTGLGLVLCREFIEKNNGMIWAESDSDAPEAEKGSTFHIALPMRPM